MKKGQIYIIGFLVGLLIILNVINYLRREQMKKEYRLVIEEGIEPISINSAGSEELECLPGVGPALAQRIVEYRERYGPFRSLIQLKEVRGIGDKLFQKILPFIKL